MNFTRIRSKDDIKIEDLLEEDEKHHISFARNFARSSKQFFLSCRSRTFFKWNMR